MSQTYHTVGGTHVVTRAYPPDALSSVRCVNSIGVGQTQHSVLWEPIDYNDLYYPIPVTESLSRVDRCFTNRADNDIWGNWMRQPFISLPKDVSQLDPTWTTCSGVAIGAMDPPRALVPAAGWEDSPPPSAPADPPTPEHVTSSNPSLPKATPGKTVPDPVPRPTSGPTKGADSTTQPVPKPNTDPPQQPHESPHTQPDPPKPSSIPKEPSKSPAAVTPQPQQPAPQAPNVNPSSDSSSNNPGNSINARPPTDDNNPAVQQPSGNQGTEQRAGSDPFNSISAALFSSPSPNPSPGMQNIGGGTESQVPSGQQHTSTPNYQGGSSDQGGKEGSTSGQISPGSQNKGNSGYNPPAASPQDQSPDSNHQIHPNGQPASDTGNHAASANNDESQTGASGSSGGSDTGPDTGNGGSKGSSNGESSQQGSSPQGDNPNTKSGNRPTTFAFVSNDPAPVVGSHTIAMAPDGAAIVGTATIHPGQAQDVQGIAVSVAPNAIVVGPSIFAITTPQEAETPAAAPVVSQAPGGGLIIGSKTIMPGQKDSVNGHDVSVGPSNVVIDGKSMAFPAVTPHASIGPVNIGGVQIDRGSGNVVVIGGSTYKPGAQVTVSGHTVSIGSDEAAVAGTTYSLPSGPAGGPLLVGAQTVRKDSNDHVLIGTSTLLPGSQISMAGHVVSVGAGNKVIVDQSTYALPETAGVVQVPSLPDAASTEPLMVDGRTVSKDASGRIIVGSSTVVSGSKITIAGHVISAASSKIIVDQSTYDLPATAGAVESPAATPVTLSNGIVLTPGATAVTLSGEIISVFSNDKGFVIDGSTVTLPSMASAAQSIFTVAGQVFTAAPTGFSIGGTTVSPRGSAITISGTVVSLGLAGLQIDSQTIPLPTSTATQPDLGDVIMSAFEQDGASSATAAGSGSAGTPMPTAPGNVQSSRSGSSRHIEDAAVFFWVLAGNLVFGILVFVI